MSDNKLVKFESEIRPLAGGDILHAPPDSLSSLEAVEAYAIIKYLVDRAEERRKELRKRVLEDEKIIEHGSATKSGGTNTNVKGHKVTRKKQLKRFANAKRISELLEEKGLSKEDVFDKTIETKEVWVVNPSKMEKLLDVGRFTEEEIESCHVETWTLIVKAASELKELLEIADQKAAANRQLLEFNNDWDD